MLDDFLRRITRLKDSIDRLRDYTGKFGELYSRKLRDVLKEDEEKKISQEIEAVAELFKRQSHEIKDELERIKEENDAVKKRENEDSLEYQSRNMHWQRCTKNLTAEINRFRHGQLKYARDEESKLKSQYMAINPGATEEEVNKIISRRDCDAVMQKALAGGTESSRKQLEDVKDKNARIRSLSKRLDELLELITELQRMVNQSGAVVDKIEVKMAKTKASTETANKDLETAYRYQVNAMWLKRVIYGLVTLGIIFGVLFLLLRYGPSWAGSARNIANGDNADRRQRGAVNIVQGGDANNRQETYDAH